MSTKSRWHAGFSTMMALGITAGSIAPFISAEKASAQTSFYDVSSNYWAANFIQELSQRGVIAGFPDGSFRPEEAVTRAQFAAMIRKAFQKAPKRQASRFNDVSTSYWAYSAIQESYTTGFLSGYPGNRFAPNQKIPREQVLVSLANGLEYNSSGDTNSLLANYRDAYNISNYARNPIAAATEKRMVVNYPNVEFLNPKVSATRAQVAAFIYQALASNGQVASSNSPYVVAVNSTGNPTPVAVTIPSGTVIPVKYDKAEKILVTKDETAPLTLTVSQNVITDRGDLVIPAGSQVVGNLRPADGGSQFVAQKLVLTNGTEYQVNATSEVITKTETVRKGRKLTSALKNAAYGAGAAAAVAAVTGDRAIATEEVLGGAAIGGLIGVFFNKKKVDLIAIDPDTDLQMTIGEQFQISLR
ncbi:MAG: S-layer homology domain-containing protein [Cyanobacteria bacterium P01_A01_bin.45]